MKPGLDLALNMSGTICGGEYFDVGVTGARALDILIALRGEIVLDPGIGNLNAVVDVREVLAAGRSVA
jgi:hypothetical protein